MHVFLITHMLPTTHAHKYQHVYHNHTNTIPAAVVPYTNAYKYQHTYHNVPTFIAAAVVPYFTPHMPKTTKIYITIFLPLFPLP